MLDFLNWKDTYGFNSQVERLVNIAQKPPSNDMYWYRDCGMITLSELVMDCKSLTVNK